MDFSIRMLLMIVAAFIAALILIAMMAGWGQESQEVFGNFAKWMKGLISTPAINLPD